MDRDMKDLLKLLAALAALIGAVVAGVLLILRYKEEICDFFAELKMKCPCKRCEEDDYFRRRTQQPLRYGQHHRIK